MRIVFLIVLLKSFTQKSEASGSIVEVWINAARWGGNLFPDMQKLFTEDQMFSIDVTGESGETALQVASSSGQSEVVSWLIDQGADIDAHITGGSSPLISASRRGHANIIQQLLSAGCDATIQHSVSKWTALHMAAMRKDMDTTVLLLEYDSTSCSIKDKKGRTPLELAKSKSDNEDVIGILKEYCDSNNNKDL